jgi:hypothetical protein
MKRVWGSGFGIKVQGLRLRFRVRETWPPCTTREQLLRSNAKQFQGELVFKARRLVYHSTLGREQ